ncbi:MAG: hypothetical protein Q8O69_02330 [Pseudomonas sp.]|nr:hypothetical protein [Pseudomonas sp.]MDP2745355.1 hypothetical protein [Pseudomonas sp.]
MDLQPFRKGRHAKIRLHRRWGYRGNTLRITRITSGYPLTLVIEAITIGIFVEQIEDAITIQISTLLALRVPAKSTYSCHARFDSGRSAKVDGAGIQCTT